MDCPSCHQYVNAQTHRCYIQRALTPQEIQEQKKERKRKRRRQGGPPAKRGAAAGLQTLRANEEEEEEDVGSVALGSEWSLMFHDRKVQSPTWRAWFTRNLNRCSYVE